ncbi:ribulose-phosphate 3-epimerase [Demequina aurantiaca]|uniref:ribulose-phosphate 3-epimerase n=1 Tax=Demequina aurantiaca TaxID=676200 RepID=UPI003D327398
MANSNMLTLGSDLDTMVSGGVEAIHIDIMDGHYVPNLCFPVSVVKNIKQAHPGLVVDGHLMVDEVEPYIARLADAGCDAVSFPVDSTRFARRAISSIQASGMRAGVAINPSQPIGLLEPILGLADYVVLMTVEPGFAGQTFLPGSLARLEELVALRAKLGSAALIEIDGGVTYEGAEACARLGAEIFVTGIYTVYDPALGLKKGVQQFDARMEKAGFPTSSSELDRLRRIAR